MANSTLISIWNLSYLICLFPFSLLNGIIAPFYRRSFRKGAVLHIDHMSHVVYDTVKILRNSGMDVRFLARGNNPEWKLCDIKFVPSFIPPLRVFQEFMMFWRTVSRYEIIHLHRLHTMTHSGWEMPLLKKLGRKLVIHYRGCEMRDWKRNMKLHPDVNICQECDYNKDACSNPVIKAKLKMAGKYGDFFIVTTPDMKDFAPDAEHMPFFCPEESKISSVAETTSFSANGRFKIVHATNHPGIEGTRQILKAVENLKSKGLPIDFVFLKGVSNKKIMDEFADADMAIGKMKMGYYANAQIESMFMGVPTITWVRPDLMSDELRESEFIFSDLEHLESTIEFYFENRQKLEIKRKKCRESVRMLHDNSKIAERHAAVYANLTGTKGN